MILQTSYPVLMVDDAKAAADFYVRFFGFEETFSTDWYVSLRHGTRPPSELAFVQAGHDSIPANYRHRAEACSSTSRSRTRPASMRGSWTATGSSRYFRSATRLSASATSSCAIRPATSST
jgi:catechol 2,3-dioxygenase-like lactoylglutathione lyase family enzyme